MKECPKNLVKSVSYKENVIIVEFTEEMNIGTDKEHNFLNKMNYAIENNNKLYQFPITTLVYLINLGVSVKFIFPQDFIIYLNQDSSLHIGYITRKKIFYVKNSKGEIVNICDYFNLKNEIETIDIENGNIQIINKFAFKYTYNGKNKFDYLNKDDFYVIKNNQNYYPKKINVINSKEFLLIFNNEIFNIDYSTIMLKVRDYPKSLDIYGFSILSKAYIYVINYNKTYIKNFTFTKYLNNVAYFKIFFSNPLKFFNENDFKIILYDINYKIFLKEIDIKKELIYICIENIILSNVLENNFYISMNVNYNDVKTLDIYGNKVFIKTFIKTDLFICNKFELIAQSYNMQNAIFKIDFSEKINYSSIITNSDFNEHIKPWNGKQIIIPPNNLIINHKEDYDVITLNHNESFGEIFIYSELKYRFTNKSLTNSSNCYLYSENDCIYIQFDKNEIMETFLVFIEKLKYAPNENIKSDLDNNIYTSYSYLSKVLFKGINYIRQLDNIKENPFNGQLIEGNCIMVITEENKCKFYGENLYTKINGDLVIVGILKENDLISIQLLLIYGNLLLHIKDCSYNLDKIICKNIIFK